MSVQIINEDCRTAIAKLDAASMRCCVTSPPYFGLRDYGAEGQIGIEQTPDAYITEMVKVFRDVKRVLREDGTLWLNLGDSYARAQSTNVPQTKNPKASFPDTSKTGSSDNQVGRADRPGTRSGGKPKDLLMIPARVALALQADGWWLRSDIIWHKPNPMPESVTDRPSSAHEHVFLLTKSERYFYDANAIRTPPSDALLNQIGQGYGGSDTKDFSSVGAQSASNTKNRIIDGARARIDKQRGHGRRHAGFNDRWDALTRDEQMAIGSNARNVWTIATRPFNGAHFATMPPDLAERCILAGSTAGDTILDPFGGAGTTGLVADRLGRNALLIELNSEYANLARERMRADCPMFASVA